MIHKGCAIILLYILTLKSGWSQHDTTRVFGESGKDINRPYQMIKLPGGNLIWAGEWNNSGILMKISPEGKEINKILINYKAGATGKVKDLLLDIDHTIVAVGECAQCAATDSLTRLALYRIDTSLDKVLARSLISGKSKTSPLIYNPSIARNNNALLITATQAGEGDNYEDIFWASISTALDTLWTKSINTCNQCSFEFPVRMIATEKGFTSFVYHNYTDSATIYHMDPLGNILWKQRSYTYHGVAGGAITAYRDKLYIGVGVNGLPQEPFYFAATVITYDENTGTPLNATSLSDPFTDRAISSLAFAQNGNLIVGYRRSIPSFSGSLLTSQVLRLDLISNNPKFIDSKIIPGPNETTNMGVIAALPLNDDGSKIGAIGTQGGNRTFYFTNVLNTVPVRELNEESKLSITPNPIEENHPFTIHIPSSWPSIAKTILSIYNLNGMMIKQIKEIAMNTDFTMPGLPKGIYTVILQHDQLISRNKILIF